ncbi:MAG: hypothetical protein GY822_10300 [Deltaproteobacteria bacterium]|nr:hypothetical protein [Deltaproteobacteria bacterium]
MKSTPFFLLALFLLSAATVPNDVAAQAKRKLSDLALKTPAVASDEVVLDRVVALVGKEVVLQSELHNQVDLVMRQQQIPAGVDKVALYAQAKKEVLDGLIAEKLIEREVRKLRIEVTPEEVDRVVQSTMAQRGLDLTRLTQALAQQGMSLKDYKDGLKKQLIKAKIIQIKVKSRVKVTDADLEVLINQENAQARADFSIKARHILFLVKTPADDVKAKAKANDVLKKVQAGANFSELAIAESEGPSGKNGGFLGVFSKGDMVPEFEKAAFNAVVGEATTPVKTPFGWHIILVEERVVKQQKLEDILMDRRRAEYEKAVERAFRQYIEELKQNAYIEVRL